MCFSIVISFNNCPGFRPGAINQSRRLCFDLDRLIGRKARVSNLDIVAVRLIDEFVTRDRDHIGRPCAWVGGSVMSPKWIRSQVGVVVTL